MDNSYVQLDDGEFSSLIHITPEIDEVDNTSKPNIIAENEDEKSDLMLDDQDQNSMKVFLRVRPINKEEEDKSCFKCISQSRVLSFPPLTKSTRSMNTRKGQEFTFSRVFDPTSTQTDVFDSVALPMANEVLNGGNGLLFAYGMTNSGKTHSILGSLSDPGILPRCVSYLLEDEKIVGGDKTLSLSYLEIYNNNIYDLLGKGKKRSLKIQDRGGEISVKGLASHDLTCAEMAMELLMRGQEKRTTHQTSLNSSSSRSHSVCTLKISWEEEEERSGGSALRRRRKQRKESHFWIVDLAGFLFILTISSPIFYRK